MGSSSIVGMPSSFLSLSVDRRSRAEVGDGRGHQQYVAAGELRARQAAGSSAAVWTAMHADARRRLERDVGGDHRHLGAARGGLARRARTPSAPRSGCRCSGRCRSARACRRRSPARAARPDASACAPQQRLARLEQLGGLGQPPDAVLAVGGELALAGCDDRHAARASSSRLACVAGFRYIRLFIAGATATGQAAASAAVRHRLSAWPWASLAIVFAVAGRDQVQVGALDQREVADRRALGQRLARVGAARRIGLELAGQHRRAGDPLERGAADEPLARSASGSPARRGPP